MSDLYITQYDGIRKIDSLGIVTFLSIPTARSIILDGDTGYVYAADDQKVYKIDLPTFSIISNSTITEQFQKNYTTTYPEPTLIQTVDHVYINPLQYASSSFKIAKIRKETLEEVATLARLIEINFGMSTDGNYIYTIAATSLENFNEANLIKIDPSTLSEVGRLNLSFYYNDPTVTNPELFNVEHNTSLPIFIDNNYLYLGYWSSNVEDIQFGEDTQPVRQLKNYLLKVNLSDFTETSHILMPEELNKSWYYFDGTNSHQSFDPDEFMGPAVVDNSIAYLTADGTDLNTTTNVYIQYMYVVKYDLTNNTSAVLRLPSNSGTEISSICLDKTNNLLYIGTDGINTDYLGDSANNLIKISTDPFEIISSDRIASGNNLHGYTRWFGKHQITSISIVESAEVDLSDKIKLDAGGISIIKSDVELEDLSGNSTDFLPDEQVQITSLTGDAKVFKNYSRENSNHTQIQIHVKPRNA